MVMAAEIGLGRGLIVEVKGLGIISRSEIDDLLSRHLVPAERLLAANFDVFVVDHPFNLPS
jgi:hypothetical protein